MTTHSFRTVALGAALLAIGASLAAQGPGPGRGAGRGLRALHLTEAQQTQVKAIHEKHQAALKAKMEAARDAHKAFADAARTATADTATLKALHDKASAAQFEVMLEHRAVRAEIQGLLTDEQKAAFKDLPMGPGGPGMGGPGHPGKGRGRGPGGPGMGMGPDCPF